MRIDSVLGMDLLRILFMSVVLKILLFYLFDDGNMLLVKSKLHFSILGVLCNWCLFTSSCPQE